MVSLGITFHKDMNVRQGDMLPFTIQVGQGCSIVQEIYPPSPVLFDSPTEPVENVEEWECRLREREEKLAEREKELEKRRWDTGTQQSGRRKDSSTM